MEMGNHKLALSIAAARRDKAKSQACSAAQCMEQLPGTS